MARSFLIEKKKAALNGTQRQVRESSAERIHTNPPDFHCAGRHTLLEDAPCGATKPCVQLYAHHRVGRHDAPIQLGPAFDAVPDPRADRALRCGPRATAPRRFQGGARAPTLMSLRL